jgi:hypothetical protein
LTVVRRSVGGGGHLTLLGSQALPSVTVATTRKPSHFTDVVSIRRPDGSTYECQIGAHLDWHLGEEDPEDDSLFASTTSEPGAAFECEEMHKVVTLRWSTRATTPRRTSPTRLRVRRTRTSSRRPAFTDDGAAYEDVSSEHRWVFPNCASNCERVHTFSPM